MKILHILTTSTGGINTCVDAFISELRNTHKQHVLSGIEDYFQPKFMCQNRIDMGVEKTFINLKGCFNVYSEKNYLNHNIDNSIENCLKEISPDVVHIHSLHGLGVSVIDIVKRMKIPIVLTIHDWWLACPMHYFVNKKILPCKNINLHDFNCSDCNFESDFIMRRRHIIAEAINKVDRLTAPSEYLLRSISRMLDIRRPIELVENGVYINHELKNIKKSGSEIVRFGFLGGNNIYKGLHLLLKSLLKENMKMQLVVAGVDYIENPNLKKYSLLKKATYLFLRMWANPFFYIKLKNLVLLFFLRAKNRNIKILPRLSKNEMIYFYSNIDILIIPSVMQESFSYLARESLLNLTPVIVSRCGGPEEIIKDGVNGFLFKINNCEELKGKMEKVIGEPKIISTFVSNILRDYNFVDVKDQVKNVEDMYKEMVNK